MRLITNRRFEYGHGLSITRCLALILSTLTMIGSIGILGFGIQILLEVSFISPIIGTNEIVFCPYLVILVGVLTFGMTPVGFYSIVTSDGKLMVLNMFGTFFIAALCVLSGILGYNLNSHVNNPNFEIWMKNSIRDEFGNPEVPYTEKAWNRVHQQFKCCGAASPKDWIDSKWYLNQKQYPKKRTPESCCSSCATMHENFCVAFFVSPDKTSSQLLKNQTLCLQASSRCESADSSIANREVCMNHFVDYNFSADAYRHLNGCIDPIRKTLDYFSNRICIYSLSFFIILFLSTLTWFVVHEISDPFLPLRV